MNGFSTAATPHNFPVPPPLCPTPDTSRPSFPTTPPEFSSFKFKNIGQPPTLLSRFSDTCAASDYRSPSPVRSDIDMLSSEDPMIVVSDDHRTLHPTPRRSLLDMLGGGADQGHSPKGIITTQAQESGVPESIVVTSPPPASPSKHVLPRPESRMSSIARQLSGVGDAPRTDPAPSRASVAPGIHLLEPQDSDMTDLYADPDSPSRSPLSLFSDLSEVVRESTELDRITSLHRVLAAEREELLRRHEEAARALSRTKSQLDHVLSLTDEAVQMTTVFVDKEKTRLETKKTKVEARIEHKRNLEAEQRRKAKELERIRQQEEERRAQAEKEAERCRLEEQRKKEEALAAEKQRLEETQAQERAQAEEHRRMEEERIRIEEERRQLAEEDQRRRDEEERERQAEEQRKEEERLRKRLAEEKEAMARKQEEERRTQLLERRRQAEEERKRKEAEAAAAKAEAEKQAAEKEQQRIFMERRAIVLKDKFKNYHRPEFGTPSTGPPTTIEGTPSSGPPPILINDVPKNLQVITEQHPSIAKTNKSRETPTFVPAVTEAGRLPPDLSQQVKASGGVIEHTVKHETSSPLITPIDDVEPAEVTPPTPLTSRSVSSMSTAASASAPPTLPAPPHLPARPVTVHPQPPALEARLYPPVQSLSRSRSPSRSPRRESPIPRSHSRLSLSPRPYRGRYLPPPTRGGDRYVPHYRDEGSRYDRDSLSVSPPPPPNPRKRAFQDHWDRADTPSKLDYSHPTKRRAASPLRSRSPPSPRTRQPTQPPAVGSSRRGLRSRPGAPQLPLEQRISSRLSERIQ